MCFLVVDLYKMSRAYHVDNEGGESLVRNSFESYKYLNQVSVVFNNAYKHRSVKGNSSRKS